MFGLPPWALGLLTLRAALRKTCFVLLGMHPPPRTRVAACGMSVSIPSLLVISNTALQERGLRPVRSLLREPTARSEARGGQCADFRSPLGAVSMYHIRAA